MMWKQTQTIVAQSQPFHNPIIMKAFLAQRDPNIYDNVRRIGTLQMGSPWKLGWEFMELINANLLQIPSNIWNR